MRTVISVLVRGNRIPVATRSPMAMGLAKATFQHRWLEGRNQPHNRRAFERACYAAARNRKGKA